MDKLEIYEVIPTQRHNYNPIPDVESQIQEIREKINEIIEILVEKQNESD